MVKYALIVAGGSGSRMGSDIPKQFLLLHGKPVLMHTLQRFADAGCELILVLPSDQITYWKTLCSEYDFNIPHRIETGGATRFHSVQNGLIHVPAQSLVAIHDGVRPCIRKECIEEGFLLAARKGNAVAVVKPKDSIRVVTDEEDNHAVQRENYRLIQTPQVFQSTLIQKAYEQATHTSFTDDASVLEATGTAIHLYEGDYRNIKITTPEDIGLAELFLKS